MRVKFAVISIVLCVMLPMSASVCFADSFAMYHIISETTSLDLMFTDETMENTLDEQIIADGNNHFLLCADFSSFSDITISAISLTWSNLTLNGAAANPALENYIDFTMHIYDNDIAETEITSTDPNAYKYLIPGVLSEGSAYLGNILIPSGASSPFKICRLNIEVTDSNKAAGTYTGTISVEITGD